MASLSATSFFFHEILQEYDFNLCHIRQQIHPATDNPRLNITRAGEIISLYRSMEIATIVIVYLLKIRMYM